MKHPIRIHVLGASACLALASSPAHAAQVYLETFPNTLTGSNNLSLADPAYGWSVLVTESGLISNYSSTYTGTQRVIGVATSDIAYYAPKQDDTTLNTVPNNPALAFTSVPGPINISNLTSILYKSSADNIDATYRVAIQVGGTWYASNPALLEGGADTGLYTQQTYNPTSFATASNWLAIQNTTLGNAGALSLGAAPGSDLSGNVTAFGLYLVSGVDNEANGDHVRWDDFEINAIPESSTAALGLIALLGLVNRRRRA